MNPATTTMLVLLLWQLCSLPVAAPFRDVSYSDHLARTKMLPLASAAYSKDPQECLTKKFTNAMLKRQVNVECDPVKNDTCSGYSAVLIGDKAIVLSFKGTHGFNQLIEEADESMLKDKCAWISGGKVSKYFNDAFMALWNGGMRNDFNTLRSWYPSYQVWVTGHSLGGALASLAASYVVATNLTSVSDVRLVTYGQPRIGNNEFAIAHDKQLMYSFRVTHWRDIVPHVPLKGLENYTHHKYEAFYQNSMTVGAPYKVCKDDEDIECSDGLEITTSIYDHHHYFNIDVSYFGKNGCQ